MSLVWLTSSFGYYLILSLINTFDEIYITGLTSSFSEIISYVVGGYFFEKAGVKLSLIVCFGISTFGGILIMSWGLQHQESFMFFIVFLFTKFGVSCTFMICFVANSYFFPTLFAATAIGFCYFMARFVTIFSYPISNIDEPWPMIIFTSFCALTCFACFFLRSAPT